MSIESKLVNLGIVLPVAPKPLAAYVPAIVFEKFVFTSGQLPIIDGALMPGSRGKVGIAITKEQAKQAARQCALNALAAMVSVLDTLERVDQIIKITVFVASESGFSEQPFVANGASELFLDIFGEKGIHARSAVGVAELPLSAAVELEVVASLK